MAWFTRNKSEAPKPDKERRPDGFFSTDHDAMLPRADLIAAINKRTFQRTIKDHVAIIEDAGAMVAMDDAVAGIKNAAVYMDSVPDAQLAWYSSYGFIGYQVAAIIAQHWLVKKACKMPGRDAVRKGYEITINDGTKIKPEILNEFRRLDKRFRIRANMVDFVHFGRIFGVRFALPVVESGDPDYLTKPFNPDGVTAGSYRGIRQIDPYWISPILEGEGATNPLSLDFYEPKYWQVNGRRIHKSHLIIMRNDGKQPDILKPTYLYGGTPLPQMIAERIYAAERTANEAPMLAMTKRLISLKLDAEKAIANQKKFEAKMSIWQRYMNNFGVKILGDDESIEQFDTSLADLDDVIMSQYQLVAAIADVPCTKLLGTVPKGFNATGEYDEASYHEFLESIQEHDLTPLLERHVLLCIRSEIAPKFKIDPFDITINWKPCDAPTAKELAETNLAKAQTDYQLAEAGAIDGQDIRDRLIADPDSGYNWITSEVPVDADPDLGGAENTPQKENEDENSKGDLRK